MKRTIAVILCAAMLSVAGSVSAQAKKSSRSGKGKAKVEKKAEEPPVAIDTVAPIQVKDTTPYKSMSDPIVVRYLRGGYAQGGKLYLVPTDDYTKLDLTEKGKVLGRLLKDFKGYDIILYPDEQKRELWVNVGDNLFFLENWDNDSLQLADYAPLELKRNGRMKLFYYLGGSFSGGKGYSSGSLNLRSGTYLFKDILDASITLNMGYSYASEQTQFAGDVSVASKLYFPLKKLRLSPYAGTGISWAFAPSSYFELQLMTGGCWFVGSGSIDFGAQYGLKSGFSLTLGYTFRP